MNYKEEENKLFERWKKKRPNLILDGIVDGEIYSKNNAFKF